LICDWIDPDLSEPHNARKYRLVPHRRTAFHPLFLAANIIFDLDYALKLMVKGYSGIAIIFQYQKDSTDG
jgi:hypothetical protein